ncbi:MAG: hypothetical protein U0894_00450 [Pirellulales bacterium]
MGSWVSQHGFGTSPMIYGDMVVITSSQENEEASRGLGSEEFYRWARQAYGETSVANGTPRGYSLLQRPLSIKLLTGAKS